MVAQVYTPLSELIVTADLPIHLFLPDAAGSLARIYVTSHYVVQTPFGAQVWAEAVLEEELSFGSPLLPLAMIVGPTEEDTPAVVRWLLEDEWSFEAEGLSLALRFDPSFLRPADPALAFAEIAAQGSIRLEHGTLRHLNPVHAFSLPPSEIAGLGLIVSFEDILFDFSDTTSPPEILALGFDASFRGMYAASGTLTILPMLQRAGGQRGITLDASHIAIRTEGVTCTLSHELFVERLQGVIGEDSAAVANLFSPEWQVALAEVSLELRDSALQSFGATGVLNVPFFDSLLDLELSAQMRPTGGLRYGATVTAAEAGTLTTPLGAVSYETLSLEGEVGDDAFAASGTVTGLAVSVEGFPISAALAAVQVRHGDGPLGMGIRLEDLQLGTWGGVAVAELAIGERRPDGRVAHRLVFGIDAPLPLGTSGLVLEQGLLTLEVTTDTDGSGDWRELLGNATIDLAGLRLTGPAVPGGVLSGDLRVVFQDGVLQPDQSHLRRDGVNGQGSSILGLKHLHLSSECVAVSFSDPQINYWLRQLGPDLIDRSEPAVHEISLRVVLGTPIQELRLDWDIDGNPRTVTLPGIQITVPDHVRLSVLLGAAGRPLSSLAVALTFPQGAELSALSSLAWMRDADRELHGGESNQPILELQARAIRPTTLVLLDWDVEAGGLPTFFRQLASPLLAFDWANPETLEQPTPYAPVSLRPDDWSVTVHVNLETLPFLRGGAGSSAQFLQIDPARTSIDVRLAEHVIRVDLGLNAHIGPIRLETGVPLEFDWETFAFDVPHDLGLALLTTQEVLQPADQHLGLTWRFRGTPAKDRNGVEIPGRYHLLTLTTRNHHYSLLQAPGAEIEIEYTQLSDDAIGFAVTDFALTPKGISLTAEVIDRPVTLNGLDTRFRFADTRLVIVENRITDFTLRGAGPLPPALVGDATADVALQLAERGGRLTLVAGGAQLKGSKLLDCKGTRFQFSIQAIGLKFVYEGKFHLYFTLTGSAQFKLADGDDRDGALALLPNIKIDLVECPLAGDAKVLSKHISFLVELPRPRSFSFLGAFEMELRGIGFVPQADVFGGDGAMLVTGQLRFAPNGGDAADTRVDLHKLYIGLPKRGSGIPRIHFGSLPVNLKFGSNFRLNGAVGFVDGELEKGFSGEGTLEIEGLPTLATAFAFLRVRRDETSPWVRAWFVYAEVRKISLQLPVIPVFLREVGLGFGYRYTLASIRVADQANDVGQLIAQLRTLSRTQGDLSRRDRWAVDLEDEGQDPRWTVAFRALLSQTSAATSPLRYDETAEQSLPCLFLLDTVVALRSDLTFLMAARGWLFANYYDYVTDHKGLREKPVVSGYVLLSPRKKRFLAHLASNPGGQFGQHPPMPPLIERALANSEFSATLLIEPGLLHTELGWPNQLRWKDKLGPLAAEFRGGFIFRVSSDELVTGVSYLAQASLEIKASVSRGIVGVRVAAEARVSYGGRYIGLLSLRDPLGSSAMYGGVGLELMLRFSVELWMKIKRWRVRIKKTWRFSFTLQFTASLEIGIVGVSPSGMGLRGSGHLAVSAMGRRFSINVKLGLNEGAVSTARERTQHVLNLGLEAAEVEAIPGTSGTGLRARGAADAHHRRIAAAARAREALPDAAQAAAPALTPTFHAPGYTVFVIRGETEDDPSYFILLPAGERADGTEEPGFLPVPPADGLDVTADFQMHIPDSGVAYTLEQYDPLTDAWVVRPADAGGARSFAWKVRWETPIAEGDQHELDEDGASDGEPTPRAFTLREYLRKAFLVEEIDVPGDPEAEPIVIPVGDPTALPGAEVVEDERVHNPSDAAFEAAVRGAMEQFRGSPYFRRDPNSEYDQLLERAYRDDTTIYSSTGAFTESEEEDDEILGEQQAHELRGVVVHDLISDLRDHAAAAQAGGEPPPPDGSIAFAMGLVFRVSGALPAWLDDAVPAGGPTLSQRLHPEAELPSAEVSAVRTFNVRSTDFAVNPPRFERVQQLTDASTIALAWDLVWPEPPSGELTAAQRDPEHHLVSYVVRRRPLDGSDREAVFTVKGADTLHREPGGVLKQLRRRFQIVDHFDETPEDLARLPVAGKSYLYSITPVDFAGHAGRPLSLVATRFPSEPPAVPVDGEATVHYRVDAATLAPAAAAPPTAAPPLLPPAAFTVRWTEAAAAQRGPAIPIGTYRLVFRREATLPIGSYGLDGSTQRPAETSLPTTNARPLPTDVKVEIFPDGPSDARVAEVPLADLQDAGVLPADDDLRWRPEAWRVFFQTVSLNGVPSTLAPVKILLRVEAATPGPFDPLDPPSDRREERRPAELEWLPRPMRLPLLPPEDQHATVGAAHVPMTVAAGAGATSLTFDPTLANVQHRAHPAGLRCVRFRWNQGPSGGAGYPLDLNAGYQLLELDTDAHSTETFAAKELLARAVRPLQDVQMIPADDLALVPSDTLAPSQWEAWYPSAALRRTAAGDRAEGAELTAGPWYSWRESILEWPGWEGLTGDGAPGIRDQAHHPTLRAIIAALAESYHVELQAPPAMQAQDLAAFLQATAPAADPYGWNVLQRFGLSLAFRLRAPDTGELLAGAPLLGAVDAALAAVPPAAAKHLHVELLFQPGRAIELTERAADTGGLLALVQLSLRPALRQVRSYGRVDLVGQPGARLELAITLAPGTSCSVIDQSDAAAGQVELSADPGASAVVRRAVNLPLGGRTTLLLRGRALPSVALVGPDDELTPLPVVPFAATDARAAYFSISADTLAAELAGGAADAAETWTAFRRYAESLSSTDPAVPDEQKILVPTTKDTIAEVLADCTAWMQRFFDHGGGATPTTRPWVATAYPRAGSPARAAPDESGRLTFDHLLEDPWAHAFRYYVRPYSRYDLLWQGLRGSPVLFPGTPRLEETTPEITGGGLDVVLERVRPVARPLVLSSARLDPAGTPASPAAPGATWEVIVAEHPEQALVAHNQTLARQLAFRQIAYTLVREFAYPAWLTPLGVALAPVPERYPQPPATLPAAPEHLDLGGLGGPLTDEDARTLDLPRRIGPFQQGALALQWEGLPFYYAHRLLLVAQTAGTVSPVNEIVQRDFAYRSPDPVADMDAAIVPWTSRPPFMGGAPVSVRARVVTLALRQLWDSLPEVAQARWPSEQPDGVHRTPGWVPDLGVVYQVVELFSGNVEVQAEIYFDEETGAFARRQLGKRFLVDVGALTAPAGGGVYELALTAQMITPQELSRGYTSAELAGVAAATRAKLAVDGKVLSFAGVMTHADRDALVAALDPDDEEAVRAMHDAWYAQAAVSEAPAQLPAELADVIDFPPPTELRLVWDGAMSAAEEAELLALPGDDELRAALARLASAVGDGTGVVSVGAPLGPEPVPPGLQPRVTLALAPGGGAYTGLGWSGNLSDADAAALTAWPRIRALASAVAALIAAADEASHEVSLPPARPIPEELPPVIAQRLEITEERLDWHGPAPTDAERAALLALDGDAAFLAARTDLLAAIDAERTAPLGPVVERPAQADLPTELSQLQIGDALLAWTAPPPTPAQRTALLALPGDRAFRDAVADLVALLDGEQGDEVPLAAFVPRPTDAELPVVLQARLVIGTDTLRWASPAPSDAERAALAALTADDALLDARDELIAQIDADRAADMLPVPRRPRQADVPAPFDEQLAITPTAVTWTGRLHDPTWRAFLLELAGDPPFQAAVQQLVQQLDAQQLEVPFAVARRPAPDALGSLTDKLILGRAALRFHGLMARAEVPAIQALFARAADQRAVARLYQATQRSGMRGRQLQIRSQRGAARPSALHPIPPKPL